MQETRVTSFASSTISKISTSLSHESLHIMEFRLQHAGPLVTNTTKSVSPATPVVTPMQLGKLPQQTCWYCCRAWVTVVKAICVDVIGWISSASIFNVNYCKFAISATRTNTSLENRHALQHPHPRHPLAPGRPLSPPNLSRPVKPLLPWPATSAAPTTSSSATSPRPAIALLNVGDQVSGSRTAI